ncbi:hypothetical protein ZOSMA_3G01760 [Zostera marina]|uniref:RING-type E3 ubiquitin transferase n=1 Tax=Zostera marina TaxID=29655 RepID=A0A0K9P654_ZOSMR|nr:hypothetical protein ZOSMA_3G01760 [Zostera marina]
MGSESSRDEQLNIILTAGGSVVVGCFLLLVYYIFLLRYRFAHAHLITPSSHLSTTVEDEDEDGDHENDQMHLRHQVWSYVRTLGLDAETIDSIPSFAVEDGDAKTSGLDCSVCLGELAEGEFVRSLPNCGHIFHVSCIDTWLGSHSSCPLCRHLAIIEADPILLETTILSEEEEETR